METFAVVEAEHPFAFKTVTVYVEAEAVVTVIQEVV
jgi:hypothetical protein